MGVRSPVGSGNSEELLPSHFNPRKLKRIKADNRRSHRRKRDRQREKERERVREVTRRFQELIWFFGARFIVIFGRASAVCSFSCLLFSICLDDACRLPPVAGQLSVARNPSYFLSLLRNTAPATSQLGNVICARSRKKGSSISLCVFSVCASSRVSFNLDFNNHPSQGRQTEKTHHTQTLQRKPGKTASAERRSKEKKTGSV